MNVGNTVRQNPFPGLRPFTTEEDYLFFGREEQTTELLGLLRAHRFLAVVGTSGSGKSSLVRAGLLPALHGGTMARAGSAWEVLLLRPGGDPMAHLARALVDAELYDPEDAESLPRIIATLNRSRLGLVEAARQSDLPPQTNLLVVVDQFEELFRFRQAGLTHQEAAAAFVKLLLAAAREVDQRIYIAITMRSDYLGECSHIAGLAEAVNDGEYLIPRLTREQRRAAIEKPVSVGGGTISHRLVQKLLNDVGDDADHLPVLQHALMRIFDFWAADHENGEPLDLRHYERAGGLNEALSRHSDEVYDELPTDRLRTVAEKLFQALTERGPDNRGIRRPTRLDTLGAIIGAQREEVAAVVEAFRQSGRTFLMPMAEVELAPHTVIDISHESLMRVWKRLDRWVEEESQSARIYRRLADTAALHAEGKADIYHDPDLQIALSWRETAKPTEAWAARYHPGFEQALSFLAKSRDVQLAQQQKIEAARQRELEQAKKLAAAEHLRAHEQKRSAHRLKWLSGGIAAVAVVALVAFGMAWAARQEAQQLAQNEAQAAADEKTARQEAENAKNRETKQRGQAEQARKAADQSRAQAVKALQKAEENFAKARGAVQTYLAAISDDPRLKEPGLSPLRAQLLQSALGFYQEFLKERADDPALRKELAAVYFKVGQIYSDLGQFGPANQSYAQSRRLYEALAAEAPHDPAMQDGLAKALLKQGQTERAITLWEKLIRPADPRYHADLGWAYNSVAITSMKDQAKALEFLRKALATRERLVQLRPGDPEARMGLGASLNNIAVALGSAHLDEQIVLYRRAASEAEVAYRLRPHDLIIIRGVVILTGNVANMAKRLGRSDEAVAASRRVIEVLDRQARATPDAPGMLGARRAGYETLAAEILTNHRMLAAYLRELGRLDEAAHVAREGRDWAAEVTTEEGPFFSALANLHLEARAVAEARAKSTPDARLEVESAASAAVAALRNHVLTGLRDPRWLHTNVLPAPFRERADFKKLIAQVEALTKAEQVAKNAQTPAAEKVTARQECLAALEALAGPIPSARFVRRSLAQARQELAQALLDAGRVEDARLAFDEALAVRQRLVEEAPANEQLRADLAQSQSAAGDLFATAGKLADAARIWEKALATLEDGLKKNPNSIPFQTALADRLLHVGYEYGKVGLWHLATKHYRRAFEVQLPTEYGWWYQLGVLFVAANDSKGLESVAAQAKRLQSLVAGSVVPLASESNEWNFFHLSRIFLLSPELASRHTEAFHQIIKRVKIGVGDLDWTSWCQGLAYIRLGQAAKGVPLLEKVKEPIQKLPALALALHQMGRLDAAREALRQADEAADQLLHGSLLADTFKIPGYWDSWLFFHTLRREAHQAIHGKPMPESPYERLFRGRVLSALDEPQKAEAEFAAAVAMRPKDADVWLTRGGIYAKLGRKDRMAADLLRAQQLKGDDPKTWIDTGRMLAERGEHKQADVAFARAAALGKGELDRFLESGWWVVGPYPDPLDLPCPPELNPDPSRPVPAVGEKRTFQWQSVPTIPNWGTIDTGAIAGSRSNASYYYLAYVHADRDRTGTLVLRSGGDARLWVNGRLALDGIAAWKIGSGSDVYVPVSLSAGRNTVLIKSQHKANVHNWCECMFLDAPVRRGYEFLRLGLWAEAADAFREAAGRGPLNEYQSRLRVQALLATGRDEEARQVFAEMVRRHGQPGGVPISEADCLPPKKTEDRERWLAAVRKFAEASPDETYRFHRLANACFRAGHFAEAETNLRKAMMAHDQLYFHPLLACTLHHLGKIDKAKHALAEMEQTHARLVKEALAANPYHPALHWEEEVWYLATRREARSLILGKDPGPSADERTLAKKAQARLAQLNQAEDDYGRLLLMYPDQPRLWIARGRRLGELKRWNEAAKAFAKAAKLALKDVQVWKERGRAYADLGKWDAAAAAFVKALELAPTTKTDWHAGSVTVYDQVVRLEEVFRRVAKLRPTDRQLWIQRVHYLARTAHWLEAAKAIARVRELDPEEHETWHFQATLLAHVGDLEGYRQVCRDMMARFGKTNSGIVAQRVAIACLLAPGAADPSSVLLMMNRVKRDPTFRGYHDAALGMGHYRRGQWDQALKVLAPFLGVSEEWEVVTLAVRAMAQHKLNQPDAARQSLQQAREKMARFAKPGPAALQDNWYQWRQAHIVLREAEALIPAAPLVVSTPGSTAQEENARRDRKARADRLSTEFALALIRVNVGPKTEAEAELRSVLARRAKLAAEEPTNADYRSDLLASRIQLGRFLADSGRIDEADKELTGAVAAWQKLLAERPTDRRARLDLAAAHRALADVAWKANRPAGAVRALRSAIDLLDAGRKEDPKNADLNNQLADAEYQLGTRYAEYALWAEAAALLARSVQRPGGAADNTPWVAKDAAQALAAAGDREGLKRVAAEFYARSREKPSDPGLAVNSAIIGALADELTKDPDEIVRMAEAMAAEKPDEAWRVVFTGACEYRAKRYEDAIRRLDVPAYRDWVMGASVLAMAHHRLGHNKPARDWLERAEKAYAAYLQGTFAGKDLQPLGNWWSVTDSLWPVREAHELITGKALPPDPLERLYRARAYLRFGASARAEAEFKAAVQARPEDSAVWLARGRIFTTLGRAAEAAADRARAQKLAEQALSKRPDDSTAADTLAGLLLDKVAEPKWTTLKPSAVKSEGGATLTVQPDASVLASGANPDQDVYVIKAEVQGRIGAIRLEAIPDPSMPAGGSGRAPVWGNFVLTDFRVLAGESLVTWSRAYADFSQEMQNGKVRKFPIALAIDADESTGWAIWPRVAERHWAVFIPSQPINATGKTRLTIRLTFRSKDMLKYALGRFRLSVTGEPDPVLFARLPSATETPHARLGAAYLALGDARRAAEHLTKVAAADKSAPAANALVLALALKRLGEKAKARRAYRQAAAVMKPVGENAFFLELVREALRVFGPDAPEAEKLLAAVIGEPPAVLTEAVRSNPQDAKAYLDRGDWYGRRGLLRKAADDLAAAYRLQPDRYLGMRLGILLAQIGEAGRYRDHCKEMLDRFAGTTKNSEADGTLKICCLLAPGPVGDPARLARLAEVAVSGDPAQPWYEWFLLAKGLYEYRAGRFDSAVKACRTTRSKVKDGDVDALAAAVFAVEAMALHRSGDTGGARRSLAEAKKLIDKKPLVPYGGDLGDWWHDRLVTQLLYREAEALLKSKEEGAKK